MSYFIPRFDKLRLKTSADDYHSISNFPGPGMDFDENGETIMRFQPPLIANLKQRSQSRVVSLMIRDSAPHIEEEGQCSRSDRQ